MVIKTKETEKLPVGVVKGYFSPLLRRDRESGVDRVDVGPGSSIRERRGDGSPHFNEGGSGDSDLFH